MAETPPVLLLGGLENSLSIVRSLSRRNVEVRVSGVTTCPGLWSRHCRTRYVVPPGTSAATYWGELLLGGARPELGGSVILACGDDAVEFLATHRARLTQAYVLDDSVPAVQLAMLDKQKTVELARSAGCPVPQYWTANTLADLEPIHRTVNFPTLIKPFNTFRSRQLLGRNFFVADSHQDLRERVSRALEHDLPVMVCEIVPGRDRDVQSSYYTYIDEQGTSLFRYTKRVLRRDPPLGGLSCLHRTQWIPETAAVGERFFRGIGFRGFGNIEFKRDPRDGQLKLIECNPRFTAAQELLTRSGVDVAYLVYCRLTGRPLPRADSFREDVYLWYPARDLKGQLKGRHGLSMGQWIRSVAHWRTAFPYFALGDPRPSVEWARLYHRDKRHDGGPS